MLHSLWMIVNTGSETLRLPADWVAAEPTPIEVPTAGGLVDLRELARKARTDPASVVVDAGDAHPFAVTFVRA